MNSLIGRFVTVWLHPWDAMSAVKQEGEEAGVGASMVFVIVMGLVSGVITSVLGTILPTATVPGGSKAVVWLATLVVPLVSFIGSFIGAFIIWGLVDGVLNGSGSQYKTAYRLLALLAAFSPVSALLSSIPKVGQYLAIAVNVWATIVMIRGIIIVRDTPIVRTWVTCGLLFAFLFVLGIFARVAAQRGFQTGAPGFGDLGTNLGGNAGGAPADDVGTASDNLEKQLQDLADKAKADRKTAPADQTKK